MPVLYASKLNNLFFGYDTDVLIPTEINHIFLHRWVEGQFVITETIPSCNKLSVKFRRLYARHV
jgi:hypothetical protein